MLIYLTNQLVKPKKCNIHYQKHISWTEEKCVEQNQNKHPQFTLDLALENELSQYAIKKKNTFKE